MSTYTARARRSGDWWAIDVPELPGVFSQARRLDLVEGMARDAIATMLGVPSESVSVRVEPVLDDDLARSIQRMRKLQQQQVRLQAEANQLAAGTAARLVERGYTLRDAGRVMGVSFQRVHQLAKRPARKQRMPTAGDR
jgi:predicted RNase H-like HicB family nuclease